jgi:hypothetical protein
MAKRRRSAAVGKGLLCAKSRRDGAPTLDEMIAGLVDLDANGLCLQWRNHLGGTPPAHLPRWLLLRVLAYRIQAAALGGLDKETLRLLGHPKGKTPDAQPFVARTPATREGVKLSPGAVLVREWDGKIERVMVMDKGFAWKGETYRSLSRIAKAMTGTNWNGHRFFGLRTAESKRLAKGSRDSRRAGPL